MANVHKRPAIEDQVKELMVQALGDLETALAQDPRKKAPLGAGLLKQYAEGNRRREVLDPINIRDLIVPGVGNRRIFRILLTNACKYSCDYCPMRSQRDLPRHALEPARLAEIFLAAFRRGWCDGLFLTSGIPKSPTVAMEKMIELVSLLRIKFGFRGYIHAKVMAGAEPGQIERIVRLVDRISYNLEAACEKTLVEHAPEKSLAQGIEVLELAKKTADEVRAARARSAAKAPLPLPPPKEAGYASRAMGATTQFVVGLGKETDRDLLSMAENLEKRKLIHHPQFAAFRPIVGTPLEGKAETSPLREQRLYQADHLLRDYGFSSKELVFDESGRLPLTHDPKLTWALQHPELFPVDLAKASREELRRVPGLGPLSVERILEARSRGAIRDISDLKKLGAVVSRACGFLSFRGRLLGSKRIQTALFEPLSDLSGNTYAVSPGTFR